MPNWADTRIVYYGDRSNLERLYHAYNKAIHKRGEIWVDELFDVIGFPVPDAVVNMRSSPYDCYLSKDVLYACHNDAWEPDVEGYAALADAFNVDFDLFSTEPGCCVAVKTDAQGNYFPEQIVVFSHSELGNSDFDHPLLTLFDSSETYFSSFSSFDELLSSIRVFLPGFDAKDIEDVQFQLDAILQLCGVEPGIITICKVELLEKPIKVQRQVSPNVKASVLC